ncbi:hypothetical protein OSH83_25095, partial [Mycobacterium ulcerans]
PPPRPPQSTIPQLTSLLINNAGALQHHRTPPARRIEASTYSPNCLTQTLGPPVHGLYSHPIPLPSRSRP